MTQLSTTQGSKIQSVKILSDFIKRHDLLLGIFLMFALTWPIDLALAAESRGMLPFNIPFAIAMSVGYGFVAASLIMTGLTKGKSGIFALLRRYLIWRVGMGWYLVALGLYPLIYLVAIGLHILLGGQTPDITDSMAYQLFGPATSLLFVIPFLLFNMLVNGEEIGWRGYVLPRLQWRYNALVSSLIIGVIWTTWHIPKFLVAGYDTPLGWYLLMTMARAVLFTWVYNGTGGSLLLVTIFHAAINTAYVFLPVAPHGVGQEQIYMIAVVTECIVALVVTLVAGPSKLSRTLPPQVEAPLVDL
jgi:membrane protease YdiL (CAAX protease family)